MGLTHLPRFLQFGPFELDLYAEELRRNGVRVRVPDQSLKVLVTLVRNSGEIVTREELHYSLWPNGTIVEFDNSINAAVRRLREALEDAADTPRYIETIPRRGYRFIGKVEPACTEADSLSARADAEKLVGQTVSHYKVVQKLGQGAMGVVYRADDTRLGRMAALKFLPDEFSDNPKALDRFEHEARAASALNHPNICTVYEIDEHEGVRFIAMEYVAGDSLDQVIPPQGLPLNCVLSQAVQIADALASTHAAGIVHRDLKPSNIMVTRDGIIKVLDFGLAKVEVASSGLDLTTPTDKAPLTNEGAIVGTLQYMAPEQLEGREADVRTDIFALGAVIYEMATGRRAFEAQTRAGLIAAILGRDPPPVSSVRSLTPRVFDDLVTSCLAKNPDDRWQSAQDLLRELRALKSRGDKLTQAVAARGRAWTVLPWVLLAILSVVLALLATMQLRQKPTEARLTRFQIPLPSSGRPWQDAPALSPDGRYIAFSAFTEDEKLSLWIYSLDSMATLPLPKTAEDAHGAFGFLGPAGPFWSPDNRFVAFFEGENSGLDDRLHFYLKKVEVSTGVVQTICETQELVDGGSWSRDNEILFSQAKYTGPKQVHPFDLYRVSARGDAARPVFQLNGSRQVEAHTDPKFLPDGKNFLYRSLSEHQGAFKDAIYLGSLEAKRTTLLMSSIDSNVIFAPPGFLLFARNETLLAQRFDTRSLRLAGEPITIPAQRMAREPGPPAAAFFSASQNGVVSYLNATSTNIQLAWYKRDGARIGSIGEPGSYENMRISPDEKQLVMERLDPQTRKRDVWTIQLATGILTRVTFGPGDNIGPEWSPSGRDLAFSSDRNGTMDLYRIPTGGGKEELLFASTDEWKVPQQWMRDGSIIFDSWPHEVGVPHRFYQLRTSTKKPRLLLQGHRQGSIDDGPIVSSDGGCAAYQSDESGRVEVYVASFPTFRQKRRVSDGGGASMWRKDGKELFYMTPDGKFMSVDVKCGANIETGAPKFLFKVPFRVDVRWIVYCVSENGHKFILGEPTERDRSLTVMLNWTEGLNRPETGGR